MYLFANELVPPVRGRFGGGVKVPCREIEVCKQSLAALLFATALWSLREQGHIRLASAEERSWIPTRKRRRIRVITLVRAPSSGLEGRIMTYVSLQRTDDLFSIIGCVVAEESRDPWKDVVAAAADEVSGVSQDCAKRATLEGALHDFAHRWQRFQTSEPVLYKALLDECGKGITARKQGRPVGKGAGKGTYGGFEDDSDGDFFDFD